jgi:hypothetical protein
MSEGPWTLLVSCSAICIFARLFAYYLRNVRGLTFRITLDLKSRITEKSYLERRHIPGRPRRVGERLRPQP